MLVKTTRVAVCVVICMASAVGLLAAYPPSPVEFVVQRNNAPQWTAQEKARGFVVCTDHWMRPMFDAFVPTREQIVDELSCTLARDEYESLQVGVHAVEDLGPVKLTVELDLPVQAYRFLYLDRELTVSTSPAEGQRLLQKQPVKMPYYLFPRTEHKQVESGKTVGFWLTIQAPAQTAQGVHSGVIRITANGQDVEVPLQVTVRDFVLPRPEIAFAPSYAAIEVNAFNMSRYTKDLAEKAGSEFWTYECCAHGFSPDYNRCYPGLFSWNAGVQCNYVWAYTHTNWDERDYYTVQPDGTVTITNGRWYCRALPGAEGPIPTIGWEAQREGVDDYRYLQLLRDSAAVPDADPALVSEVNQWFGSLKSLVKWYDLSGRYHLLVPENNDFDVMDFFDPYPQVTPQRYDRVRTEAADFIMRLGKAVP